MHAQEKSVPVEIILQKYKWTEHTLMKDSSAIQKQASSWNPQEKQQNNKTEKNLTDNDRGGRSNSGKDLE
jgi:hypothetical protein